MDRDGETPPQAAPEAADFAVVVRGEGAATIDGVPVPALGDQSLDAAVLDTLRGYAQVREAPVTAVISDPTAGYTVRVEVAPDGTSALLDQRAERDGPDAADAADASGPFEGARGPGPFDRARTSERPETSETSDGAGGAGPSDGGHEPAEPAESASPAPVRAPGARPAPEPRPSRAGQSDEEYAPAGLLGRPWLVAAGAGAVLALAGTAFLLSGPGAEADHAAADRQGPAADARDAPPPEPSPTPDPPLGPTPAETFHWDEPSPSEEDVPPSPTPEAEPSDAAGEAPEDAGAELPTGPVTIRNWAIGGCVDIPGQGEGAPDGKVTHYHCVVNSDDNQLWSLDPHREDTGPDGADLYLIRNVKDGLCLDLPGFDAAPAGTRVFQYHCRPTTDDNQLWWLDERPDGTFWIRNQKSDHMCLDVPNDVPRNGAHLRIAPCADGDDHEWHFRAA